MIIICPSCSTRFSADARLLGVGGKTVRCFNCGHKWLQEPVWEAPRPAAPIHPAPQPMPYPMPQQMPQQMPYGVPQPPPYGMQPHMQQPAPYPMQQPMQQQMPHGMPQPMAEPVPQPVAEPVPEPMWEPEPEYEPEPEPPAWEAPEDLPSDDDLNAMLGDDTEPEGMDSFIGNPDEDLENMFDEEDTEPPEISSLVGDLGGDSENEYDDPEDFPEPEPIPTVFTAPGMRREPEKKSRLLLFILIGVFVLLFGSAAGLYFLKGMVVEMVPAMAPLYEMVGLGEEPGAGLEIPKKMLKPERITEGGMDILVVRGVVKNISDMPKEVPPLKVWLHDADGNEVQSAISTAEETQLEPGASTSFKIRVEEPSALARGINVTFIHPEEAMEHMESGHEEGGEEKKSD